MKNIIISSLCYLENKIQRKHIVLNPQTELIEDVGTFNLKQNQFDYYFNDDCLLFPGFGDVHIHAREDVSGVEVYKEDFSSASLAALHGGVVQMGDMPNNPVPPVDDFSYQEKLNLMKKSLNFTWGYAAIKPKSKPLSLKVPYKVYMAKSIGDNEFQSLEEMDQTLKNYANQTISFHCEDMDELQKCEDKLSHFERRPPLAEILATEKAIEFCRKYSLNGKFCHFSTKDGLDLIRKARNDGLPIQCEVTPQHLYFSEETIPQNLKPYFQMNPPIRSSDHQKALWNALLNGEIDYLATDHAPHTIEEKSSGHSGLPGLDTYAGFVSWLIKKKQIPVDIIHKICCEKPGDFTNQFIPSWKKIFNEFNFGKGWGRLEVGYRADLSVLNLKMKYLVTKESLLTKARHSPFLHKEFPGQVHTVFRGGKVVNV